MTCKHGETGPLCTLCDLETISRFAPQPITPRHLFAAVAALRDTMIVAAGNRPDYDYREEYWQWADSMIAADPEGE